MSTARLSLSSALIRCFAHCPGLAPAQTHFLCLQKGRLKGALREADVSAAGPAVLPSLFSRDVLEEPGSKDASASAC